MTRVSPEVLTNHISSLDRIEPREYQENIVDIARLSNTLVILPTALGKTVIAILVAIERLKKYPWGKIIILAPTRPLVNQHVDTFSKFLGYTEKGKSGFQFCELNGRIPSKNRKYFFENSNVIFATPQTMKNDLEKGIYDLKQVILVILDECHKTGQKYAYNNIAHQYMLDNSDPIILGLTASPGRTEEQIRELCKRLFIERIVIRTPDDPDVKPYINEITTVMEYCSLPPCFMEMEEILRGLLHERLYKLQQRGFLKDKFIDAINKMDLITFGNKIWSIASHGRGGAGNQAVIDEDIIQKIEGETGDWFFYWIITLQVQCIKIFHLIELITTQCLFGAEKFIDKIRVRAENRKGANRALFNEPRFQEVIEMIESCIATGLNHPKFAVLQRLLRDILERGNDREHDREHGVESKVIIFTQFRDTASFILSLINELNRGNTSSRRPFRVARFVGQSNKEDDPGLSQREQKQVIREFNEGKFNVLVSTRIAEEGLDIPSVDHVIFYEPIPSEIRYIQRRGRTGRHAQGHITILVTEDTLDQVFLNVAFYRYGKMHEVVSRLDDTLLQRIIRQDLTEQEHETEPRKMSGKENGINQTPRPLSSPRNNAINTRGESIIPGTKKGIGSDYLANEYNKFKKECQVDWHGLLKKMGNIRRTGKKTYYLKRTRSIKRFSNKTMEWINDQLENLGEEIEGNSRQMDLDELREMAEFEEIETDEFQNNIEKGDKYGYWKINGNKVILVMKEA
ncbi:MAG: helicase-related protein [Promethearchaeota archaeon]